MWDNMLAVHIQAIFCYCKIINQIHFLHNRRNSGRIVSGFTLGRWIMDKITLRKQIQTLKRAMSEEQIDAASERLGELFLASEYYQNAKTIYGYLPYNQEVRTISMLEQALRDGKRVAVPKVYGDEMRFIYLEDLSQVEKGYAGIPEPIADEPVADDATALVLMPGLAFDPQGHRIGYGGGFYDKFLASEPAHPTLALCYEFQMFERLDTEEFDVNVDCVLWA
ncbi:MAG: 5-formyltetrahydrofolate cyclo-ligase [Ruminococcaceae bacterium]|nr:5-formyltetrahydrofolate cyclo-ligase [Oscillospiraceae bacterium]